LVENRRFEPTPPLLGAPVVGNVRQNFAAIFGINKLQFLGYRTALSVWSEV